MLCTNIVNKIYIWINIGPPTIHKIKKIKTKIDFVQPKPMKLAKYTTQILITFGILLPQ